MRGLQESIEKYLESLANLDIEGFPVITKDFLKMQFHFLLHRWWRTYLKFKKCEVLSEDHKIRFHTMCALLTNLFYSY